MFRCAAVVWLVLVTSPASARQWPEFRGPGGQGHSSEQHLPLEWSETKNVAWKTPIAGSGWSSPVVEGGRVWLTTAVAGKGGRARGISLRAIALDAATGKEIVDVEVFRIDRPRTINLKNSHASPTPIVRGDRVYVHFGAEGTAALTTSGEVLWRTRLPYESQHGAGGSPVLHEDLLIVNCDGNGGPQDAFVVALDAQTGKIRWKTSRRQPADQAYTSPLVIRVGSRDQVVSVGAYRATAYDPGTGKEIWRVSYDQGFSNVPRPVYGHGLVFITTGFHQPAIVAVRPDGHGDVTRTHVAWTLRRGAPLTPSPIVVGDDLFFVNDVGIASAVDARTGSIHWQQRLGGNYSASPVFADGRIYFASEEGVVTAIAPSRTFTRLATSELDGAILASMAVANGAFFIRTDRHVYRVERRDSVLGTRGWGLPRDSGPRVGRTAGRLSNAFPSPQPRVPPGSQPRAPTAQQISCYR